MKTIILAGMILISILVFLSSCSKSGVAGEKFVTDEMKNQNPFNGGEMLYFVSDSSEHFIFQVAHRNSEIHNYPLGNDIDYYYLVEIEKTTIASVSTENDYRFLMEANGLNKQYYISFSYENRGIGVTFNLPMTKENSQYIDSVKVMEQWYHDVFIYEIQRKDNNAYKLYYSTEFGVVKIDFSDDSYWELESVEW